jgi:aminopeptidase N
MKITALFYCCLSFNVLAAQPPSATINVQNYSYQLEVNDENDSIKCHATISITALKNISEFNLDLISRNNTGKGMLVQSVTAGGKAVPFTHVNNVIHIKHSINSGATTQIKIGYQGIPADGLIISKTKYGRRSFFADNWPNRARNWLVCVDDPADKAAVEFIITAPVHYQVIGNGIQLEETNIDGNRKLTHWRETIALPTKVMAIGIADFAVNNLDSTGCVPISSWVYPEDKAKGFYDFAISREILPFLTKNIGPYPFSKLANVQSKTIFGGLENASAIFYAESLVTGQRTAEPTIVHEIAHQWFGDMATEADFSHLWLSEGFATYMTLLYMEQKHGRDSLRKLLIRDRTKILEFESEKSMAVVDSSVSDYMELLNANSYQKGSWILHMLRKKLGDSVFWKGIQLYYKIFAGKNAVSSDFQKIMESVSGQNLQQFFYQWLYIPGQPKLSASWKYETSKKSISLTIEQTQKIAFVFPIKVSIYTSAGRPAAVSKIVNINSARTTVNIPVPARPTSLKLDEDVDLLFSGSTHEIR